MLRLIVDEAHLLGVAFSPLFIGARNVTSIENIVRMDLANFQSPFHRGKECYLNEAADVPIDTTFSPLFIGARNVTLQQIIDQLSVGFFQSPFHRGKECYEARIVRTV